MKKRDRQGWKPKKINDNKFLKNKIKCIKLYRKEKHILGTGKVCAKAGKYEKG